MALSDRCSLLTLLNEKQNSNLMQSSFSVEERKQFDQFQKKVNWNKVLDLMKIKGTCKELKKQVQNRSGILCRKRFYKVIKYFEKLRDCLKVFGITEVGTD